MAVPINFPNHLTKPVSSSFFEFSKKKYIFKASHKRAEDKKNLKRDHKFNLYQEIFLKEFHRRNLVCF